MDGGVELRAKKKGWKGDGSGIKGIREMGLVVGEMWGMGVRDLRKNGLRVENKMHGVSVFPSLFVRLWGLGREKSERLLGGRGGRDGCEDVEIGLGKTRKGRVGAGMEGLGR